jgi:hypothetical protein
MHVQFEDGTVASALADTSLPMLDLDAQEAILIRKFEYLTNAWPNRDAMRDLRDMALGLDHLTEIRTAMHLLSFRSSPA